MGRTAPRTLFILVDGLGLGSDDPHVNPLLSGACPHLLAVLREEAVPLDAAMGVPGIPQSATGQTALLTGVNAAVEAGRHMEGFPGPLLREITRRHNLYDALASRGYRATFANAYYVGDVAEVHQWRRQSVTTVAALKAFGTVRNRLDMERGQAVYQDLTRNSLRERGYEGSLVSPEQSAADLIRIAREHDFTLFEYFQTDRVAHKGSRDEVLAVLRLFDAFLGVALGFTRESKDNLFILTSDHGNIEDAGVTVHSGNPVPLVAVGRGAPELKRDARSITDVAPAVLRLYPSVGKIVSDRAVA